MKKFSFRIENLEVRSCNKYLLSDGEHERAEIIEWSTNTAEKEVCATIANWDKGEERYNLRFVGSRPFYVDKELFMILAKLGQEVLDNEFNMKNGITPQL